MNIIFAGYREWSYNILVNLLKVKSKKWSIQSVLTPPHPEAPFKGHGLGYIEFNPQSSSDPYNLKRIVQIDPQVILFYGWSWMVPKELFSKYMCLVLHVSKLPKYRGGSPLQHQIINGETKSATSIIRMDEGLDTGPIYAQTQFSLAGNLNEIFGRIVKAGTKDTIKVLDGLTDNSIKPTEQNNNNATFFKRRKPGENELTSTDFTNKSSEELYNLIRSLQPPYPQSYIKCKDGKKLYLTGASLK